jgi:hypothetical protein
MVMKKMSAVECGEMRWNAVECGEMWRKTDVKNCEIVTRLCRKNAFQG